MTLAFKNRGNYIKYEICVLARVLFLLHMESDYEHRLFFKNFIGTDKSFLNREVIVTAYPLVLTLTIKTFFGI